MDLSIIISITGKPGLFKVVGRSKNGLIAESLTDKKRIPVSASDKVSALSDISLFTYDEDMPLKEVLQKMHAHYGGKPVEDRLNDGDWMAEELRKVIANFDEGRVYTSDLKKLFKWYNLLTELGLIDDDKKEEAEESGDDKPKKEKKAPAKSAKKPDGNVAKKTEGKSTKAKSVKTTTVRQKSK